VRWHRRASVIGRAVLWRPRLVRLREMQRQASRRCGCSPKTATPNTAATIGLVRVSAGWEASKLPACMVFCREYNSSANPPVIPTTAAHCRRCARVWNTAAARSKVNASSTTRTGCTRASGPVARAPACSPKPTMIVAIPAHHPGLCARTHIMARPAEDGSGCSRATLRCSTDELALANAAAVANATLSSTATAGRADAGRDDPARIPAGVHGGPRTPC